ncbi:hypothetical protein JJD41_03705 [Oxynema sp. CENA135]|uniref:hypothetical protein n=1 Tax=Oxynema sp. CENA135 TaxID=984206 RepID=UPI00190E5C31|nr:hypothetical protein [Oxynema sp. CENA135]MBK4728997.1 hypothetical protein [Oxynema sp. CENA135]
MSISKSEAKRQLRHLIFDEERPRDWVQDVWGMSPTLGETAARLLDAFEGSIEACSEEALVELLQGLQGETEEE